MVILPMKKIINCGYVQYNFFYNQIQLPIQSSFQSLVVRQLLTTSDGTEGSDRGLAPLQTAGDREKTRAGSGEDRITQETLPHV